MNKMLICEHLNEKLAHRIMKFLKTDECDETTKQKVKYTLLVIIGEMEKIIILSIIYSIWGCLGEFCIAFFTLAVLRMFTGGSHRRTMMGCFLQSVINFSIIIAAGKKIIIKTNVAIMIFILGIIVTWKYVPIQSKNRIHYSKEQQAVFKVKALSVMLVYKLLESIMNEQNYNILLITLLFQLMEVAIQGVKSERKGGRDNERTVKRKTEYTAQ